MIFNYWSGIFPTALPSRTFSSGHPGIILLGDRIKGPLLGRHCYIGHQCNVMKITTDIYPEPARAKHS